MKILRLISPTRTEDYAMLRVLVEKSNVEGERFGTVSMVEENPHIKVGEYIVFGQYAGTDLAIPNDKCYFVMRLSDIYAVVDQLP